MKKTEFEELVIILRNWCEYTETKSPIYKYIYIEFDHFDKMREWAKKFKYKEKYFKPLEKNKYKIYKNREELIKKNIIKKEDGNGKCVINKNICNEYLENRKEKLNRTQLFFSKNNSITSFCLLLLL